jgi:hypothetical protein
VLITCVILALIPGALDERIWRVRRALSTPCLVSLAKQVAKVPVAAGTDLFEGENCMSGSFFRCGLSFRGSAWFREQLAARRRSLPRGGLIWRFGARSFWQLVVKRLTVSQAAAEELRPRRNCRHRVCPIGQEPPERRLMPAEIMARAVAVVPNAGAKLLRLSDQLLARHSFEIFVHAASAYTQHDGTRCRCSAE